MSKCLRIRELINQKLDNEIDKIEELELEEHLLNCENCRIYYKNMIDVHKKLLSLPFIDSYDSIVDQINFNIDDTEKMNNAHKDSKVFSKPWIMRYGLAAAAILVLIVPITFLTDQNKQKMSNDSNDFFAAEAPNESISLNSFDVKIDDPNVPLERTEATGSRTEINEDAGEYSGVPSIEVLETYKIETVNNQLIIYKDNEILYKTSKWEDNLDVKYYLINEHEVFYSLFSKDNSLEAIASYKINLIENKEEKVSEESHIGSN